MSNQKQTFDTPWKDVIESFFPQFMAFFVPDSQQDIDWNAKIKFLDKEFQKVTRSSVVGRKHADKLIEVTLYNQAKRWVLIHVEVQAQRETVFSERMFVYNYRIYDRFEHKSAPRTDLAYQLLQYMMGIWRQRGPSRGPPGSQSTFIVEFDHGHAQAGIGRRPNC